MGDDVWGGACLVVSAGKTRGNLLVSRIITIQIFVGAGCQTLTLYIHQGRISGNKKFSPEKDGKYKVKDCCWGCFLLKDTVRNHLILPQNAPPWCPALTAPGMMTNGLSNREASRPTHIRHGLGLGRTFKLRLKCLPGEFADLNMKLIKDVWVQNLSWLTIPWGPSGFVCFD